MTALGRPHLGLISGLEEAVRGRWQLRLQFPQSLALEGDTSVSVMVQEGQNGPDTLLGSLAWTSGLSHVMDSRRPATPTPPQTLIEEVRGSKSLVLLGYLCTWEPTGRK